VYRMVSATCRLIVSCASCVLIVFVVFAVQLVWAGDPVALTEPHPAPVSSTPMEAALDALRARFPNEVVLGFEELWDPRPDIEPQVDLGPPDASLGQVLQRIRLLNPKYKADLLQGGLVHVYPAHGTADPVGLLDLRLREFFLPPDDCLPQQMNNYTDSLSPDFSYTPELSAYLVQKKAAWYHTHGKSLPGIVGDFMGNCRPADHRREPIYNNTTVREALNLMALRSLQIARGPNRTPSWAKPKPISWKYRFRRDPNADTGLGGVPVFQSF
jgi:hypothetical protein